MVGYLTNGAYRRQEEALIVVRDDYVPDGTSAGVIAAHGGGGGGRAFLAPPSWSMIAAIAAAGYPVLCPDLGRIPGVGVDQGEWTFGNRVAVSSMTDAWTFLHTMPEGGDITTGIGTCRDRVLLVGGSMGALSSLQWARVIGLQDGVVAGVACIIPVIDLEDVRSRLNDVRLPLTSSMGLGQRIETAWGIHRTESLPAGADLAAVPAEEFVGLRLKIWFSTNDGIVPPDRATSFVQRLSETGINAEASCLGLTGHSARGLDASELVDYLEACLADPGRTSGLATCRAYR